VGGLANISPAESLGVTSKAIGKNLLGRELRKSDDGAFAAVGIDMRFARPMTTFASGAVSWFFTGRQTLVVRILVEPSPNIRVT